MFLCIPTLEKWRYSTLDFFSFFLYFCWKDSIYAALFIMWPGQIEVNPKSRLQYLHQGEIQKHDAYEEPDIPIIPFGEDILLTICDKIAQAIITGT